MPDAAPEITVPPEVLQTVREALSQTVGAVSTSDSDIRVMAAPTAENGFALNVTYNGNVFGVTFGMPTGDETSWTVTITMTLGSNPEVTLLSFNYDTAKGTWGLVINSPKVTIGAVTINKVSIDMGSTPAHPS